MFFASWIIKNLIGKNIFCSLCLLCVSFSCCIFSLHIYNIFGFIIQIGILSHTYTTFHNIYFNMCDMKFSIWVSYEKNKFFFRQYVFVLSFIWDGKKEFFIKYLWQYFHGIKCCIDYLWIYLGNISQVGWSNSK